MLNVPSSPGALAVHGFSPLPLLMWLEEQTRNLKGRRLDTCCYPSRTHHELGAANYSDRKSLEDVNAPGLQDTPEGYRW